MAVILKRPWSGSPAGARVRTDPETERGLLAAGVAMTQEQFLRESVEMSAAPVKKVPPAADSDPWPEG